MRWSVNTAISSVVVFLALGQQIVYADPAVDAANDAVTKINGDAGAKDSANQIYSGKVEPSYGNPGSLHESAVKPLNSGTPLKNIDGVSVGAVTLMSPSDKPIMEVTMIPDFASGEFSQIIIRQDLDVDGTFDYAEVLGGTGNQVVAICSNGFVLCPTGTYGGANCSYDLLATRPNGGMTTHFKLTAQPGSPSNMFNCYCFSNHCARFNNAAVVNLSKLTEDAGATILTKFMEARPDLLVSSVRLADSVASYYGTKGITLSKVEGYTAPKKPAVDYSNLPVITSNTPDLAIAAYPDVSGMDAQAAGENAAMANVPNSLYSILNNLQKSSGSTSASCTIRRTVSLYTKDITNTQYVEKDVTSDLGMKTRYNVESWDPSGSPLTFSIGYAWTAGLLDPVIPANTTQIALLAAPASASGLQFKASAFDYSCPYTCVANCGPSTTPGNATGHWSPGLPGSGPWTDTGTLASDPGIQTLKYKCTMTSFFTEEGVNETLSNSCSTYEGDAACQIKDEFWDDQPYISNFLNTGYRLSQTCGDYPGVLRSYRICKDWMTKKRTYVCDRTSAYDFTPYLMDVRSRVKGIQDAAILPDSLVPPDSCEFACKVKVARKNTMIRPSGVDSDVKRDSSVTSSQYDYYVKSCTKSAGSYSCPVDSTANEIIDKDCACLNEYGEALARTDALQRAANDTICTSNPVP